VTIDGLSRSPPDQAKQTHRFVAAPSDPAAAADNSTVSLVRSLDASHRSSDALVDSYMLTNKQSNQTFNQQANAQRKVGVSWVDDQNTNGIVYVRGSIDTSHVPMELKPYLRLLGVLMGGVGTSKRNHKDLAAESNLLVGALGFRYVSVCMYVCMYACMYVCVCVSECHVIRHQLLYSE
jgi:hypothetical protein